MNKIIYSCICGSVLRSYNGIRNHYNTKKHQIYINLFNPFMNDVDSRYNYYFNELTAHSV